MAQTSFKTVNAFKTAKIWNSS